ncbi:MAG: Vitamin K epoxide reductase [Gammaproteobacteria bacterium]|nr:Vitamin K epoxide reductase [Gammaproteobacteria bacterium]
MAKKTKKSSSPPATPSGFDATPLLVGLSLIGTLLTAYLTWVKINQGELLACDAAAGCDIVMNSRWSVLLGLPIATWGLFTYAAIGLLVWRSRKRANAWVHAMFTAFIGVAISIYLQAVSVFQIEALCPYCIASAILMTALFISLCVFRPAPRLAQFSWASFAPATGIFATALVVAMHMHYSGVFDASYGPQSERLKALATHLDESGAKFYGAYWCPHCNDQKELFGASAKRLPYVECAPGGRNGPMSPSCAAKRIRDFPTWIINSRRHSGIKTPDQLAALSGFKKG